MTSPYRNRVEVVFQPGHLDNLKATNFALNTLHSISEFRDMVGIATFNRSLTIRLEDRSLYGSRYDSSSNTIFLDFDQIEHLRYNTPFGGTEHVSLQEVIVHELQHVVQNELHIAGDLFNLANNLALHPLTKSIQKWILEPDAIDATNAFRQDYFKVPNRDGHSAKLDYDMETDGVKLFNFPGSGFDSNGELNSFSAGEVSDGYLNGNLNGYYLVPDESSHTNLDIGFGDQFEDLPADVKALYRNEYFDEDERLEENSTECFIAGTPIEMWDGSQKSIEDIRLEDQVLSYNRDGELVPGRVTRTYVSEVRNVLDFFGTGVTPGHVYLCGDGKFKGQHVTLIDILQSDGGVVLRDGQVIRACTGEPVGSVRDRAFVWAIAGERMADGSVRVKDKRKLRLGTRTLTPDGNDVSIADLIFDEDLVVNENHMIQSSLASRDAFPFVWPFADRLPNPEDYVLQRSGLDLRDILAAGEWEQARH